MSETVIQISDLSKSYRLGVINRKTLASDLNTRWARLRGKPDPLSKVTDAADDGKNGSSPEAIWALKDISFEVKRGEVLGIIGRNGAGKSTLLKILSRVTAPTKGEVRVKGRIASLLEVGTGFHPELTGRENVFLNGAILGMTKSEIRSRFDEIVEFSEIPKFIDTPVKRYSSGMYVRLAFAVAAHLEPEILIVDEVLAVGDAAFQERCLGKMETVAKEGRTVLLVSHNMATIEHLCKRCVLLREGEIYREGVPAEVVSGYLSDSRPESTMDIGDWADRTTSGEARLTRFTVTDEHGAPTAAFPLGNTVGFRLEAEFFEPLVNPCFGVLVHGPSGEPLLDLRSSHIGLRTGRLQGKVQIEGRLPNINLYPGKYFLSPWISDGAVKRDVDFVRMCNRLEVVPKPGMLGGAELNSRWGKYYADSKWHVTTQEL